MRRAVFGRRRGGKARRDERGFVLVFISGSLSLLLLSAGLAVDLGSWYRESAHLQRAADAAALAGVVYMPNDFVQASTVATATLAKNGVVDGVNNMVVAISPDPNPHRLKVCVKDTDAPTYFTRIINYVPVINKCATAEYELAVPMGSPLNEMSASTLNGVDLAINGYCSASEDGDQYNSGYRAMFTNGTRLLGSSYTGCPPSVPDPNPYYDPAGYWYAVDVPDTSQNVTIEVYDASYNSASGLDGIQAGTASDPQITNTTFTVTDATSTPLDHTDDPVLATVTANANDMTFANQWVPIYTIPAGSPAGRYRINVATSTNPESHDLNGFDLRATVPAMPIAGSVCSSDKTDVARYWSGCPNVFAEERLGVYARNSSSTALFYLASVDKQYAGHELVVDLFDPGEGGSTIKLVMPDGTYAPFTYTYADCSVDASLPNCPDTPTSTSALDVSGQPGPMPNRLNGGIYNERLVELRTTIPADYLQSPGSTWWKLEYTYSSGRIGDRTTWSVSVPGDPVRLVDGS